MKENRGSYAMNLHDGELKPLLWGSHNTLISGYASFGCSDPNFRLRRKLQIPASR